MIVNDIWKSFENVFDSIESLHSTLKAYETQFKSDGIPVLQDAQFRRSNGSIIKLDQLLDRLHETLEYAKSLATNKA